MTDFTFSHDQDAQRYLAKSFDGRIAGEINYRILAPNLVAIDHTGTEPDFRGQGLAGKLTKFALDELRGRAMKVVPNCPFTANFIENDADYADLLG